jgi:hypothetical protein
MGLGLERLVAFLYIYFAGSASRLRVRLIYALYETPIVAKGINESERPIAPRLISGSIHEMNSCFLCCVIECVNVIDVYV